MPPCHGLRLNPSKIEKGKKRRGKMWMRRGGFVRIRL
jgi:hypothetical protein